MSFRVGAVLVAYNISGTRLQPLLAAILPQVLKLLVVDNSEPNTGLGDQLPAEVDYLPNPANLGVAAAHNQGLRWAERQGFTQLLLLDQDSLPAPNLVAELLKAFQLAQAASGRRRPVALAGAAYRNEHSARPPSFHVLQLPFSRRIFTARLAPDALVETDLLISSGALLSMAAVRQLGDMREDFFIDRVDMDWCLRARAGGYRLVGAAAAHLQHRLGEESVQIWLGRWRRVPLHRPERYYYMFRNSLLLYRSAHSSLAFLLFDLVRLGGMLLVFGLAVKKDRRARLKFIWRGLLDGCRGRSGRLAAQRSS